MYRNILPVIYYQFLFWWYTSPHCYVLFHYVLFNISYKFIKRLLRHSKIREKLLVSTQHVEQCVKVV